MEAGYGKRTLVFEVSQDTDKLISRLMDLIQHANELSLEARQLMEELKQTQ